ncbi:MAG TPA: NAD(P)/FAD-dependent oxidoreductase, partial [Amnibacterium sp.]|nr:NAD(P)/FAD-dependent oxidoreductase [Amnibacterium sp.]
VVRWKNVALATMVFQLSRRAPKLVRTLIRKQVERQVPKGYDVDTHFNPRYSPWDQRLCLVPNGDLFQAISNGSASVVTDKVATFTERGITLESGQELEADLVVTATGLNMLALGGTELVVDGRKVELPNTLGYKGMMLSDVPNMALAIGYTNASWTLKVGLVCEYFVRLLDHMDRAGYDVAVPRPPVDGMPTRPLLDFGAGYVQRALDRLPKQGPAVPWVTSTSYSDDVRLLRRGPVADRHLVLRARPAAGATAAR